MRGVASCGYRNATVALVRHNYPLVEGDLPAPLVVHTASSSRACGV